MTPRMGFEVFVAGLQRDLEMAERELQRLLAERAMNTIPAARIPDGLENEPDIARVEAEIATLKADIAKHTWPD